MNKPLFRTTQKSILQEIAIDLPYWKLVKLIDAGNALVTKGSGNKMASKINGVWVVVSG